MPAYDSYSSYSKNNGFLEQEDLHAGLPGFETTVAESTARVEKAKADVLRETAINTQVWVGPFPLQWPFLKKKFFLTFIYMYVLLHYFYFVYKFY